MNYTMSEVLQFIAENDVKFIRLAFCDIFGVQKNISIMPDELPRAFESGISFDASAVRGFMNVEESDLFLTPDPGTLSILPWRPAQGRVVRFYCDIRRPDGSLFEGDSRGILKRAAEHAARLGYQCRVGAECEFYLFETDERGNPTLTPHDSAGYCDVAPLDKGENVRREICLTLEEMGIPPESSHHEQGPGQNEIDFKYSDALHAADNVITFRSVVKAAAARNGLYASFMPKPFADRSGSGMHLNMSLARDGVNIFQTAGSGRSPEAESFTQGILDSVADITAFLNPQTNSYARLGRLEAPRFITWSHQNRSQLVRIPAATGEYERLELRSPDASCNPYLAFALTLEAGLAGIEARRPLCPPTDCNLYNAADPRLERLEALPGTLDAALARAEGSPFVNALLPARTLEKYAEQKRLEIGAVRSAPDPVAAERALYLGLL